jgi:selenocysteine lyase/cysteine desulfurase
MAGCLGAIEYLTSLGRRFAAAPRPGQSAEVSARQALETAFGLMAAWEQQLCRRLIEGLVAQKGVVVRGITSSNAMHRRVPTVSFTLEGRDPATLAKQFAARDMFVWSGHNYAIEPIGRLGLADKGGVLRVGLAHYNTPDEVDLFLTALDEIASSGGD